RARRPEVAVPPRGAGGAARPAVARADQGLAGDQRAQPAARPRRAYADRRLDGRDRTADRRPGAGLGDHALVGRAPRAGGRRGGIRRDQVHRGDDRQGGSRGMKRFSMRLAALAAALTLSIATTSAPAASGDAGRSTLQVFAAASLSDAFAEIARQLEQQRTGLTVRFNLAGSPQLAAPL